MFRQSAGVLILLFVAGLPIAAQDKKDAKKLNFDTVIGDFESYKDEKLLLKVEGKEKEYKVPGETPVGFVVGEGKTKVVKAKDYLKDVKKGSIVSLTLDGKKVLAVGVTDPPKPKPQEDKEKDKE
jgi:hypothetical protein